ncbi:MAG: helix-turn-helix transcriptional regulator [Gammaproteobacteria bacterium]|nr:helix-turn-helix transcriptional regulator [Gammaproteobacteria bacterium]
MKFSENNSDSAILKELGRRIAQHRLNRNLTQNELAKEAGISLKTLVRIEQGYPAQTPNIVRLLRALHLLVNMEALIPEPPVSPVQQLKLQGKKRKRASSKSAKPVSQQPWSWGEGKWGEGPWGGERESKESCAA